ncbi:MAG: site-2 protease family protein [archaeon]|nr:MAG: site-2 protease family protein [archaeon]
MKFMYYDLIILAAFCVFIFFFLRSKRKKIQREGIIFLYRTKQGIKFMDNIAKKLKKILPVSGWIAIILGFAMMVGIIYLLIKTIFLTAIIPMNAPPLLPLLPYVPQAFKLPLPPFYFVYWIIIIAVIAIVHEFAHGVFSKHNKVKVKSTGFGFLGPFLAAFVEPDEKQLARKKPKKQMEIFAAGTFSNLIFGIIFMLILQLFFILAYQPAGIAFMPAIAPVQISEIDFIGDYNAEEFFKLSDKQLSEINETLEVRSNNQTYYVDQDLIKEIPFSRKIIEKNEEIYLYTDSPAFKVGMSEGGIIEIEGSTLKDTNHATEIMKEYSPGDEISIRTSEGEFDIFLGEHPDDETQPYIGIIFLGKMRSSSIFALVTTPYFSKDLHVKTRGNQQTTEFFRDLLIWLVLISFLVALFNMLPVTFLDGGRMLFTLALTLTKSKKKSRNVLKIASYLILVIIILMMLVWMVG